MKLTQRLLPLGCALAMVCSVAAQIAAGQTSGVIANRVTQKPDSGGRITLKGNVHPLARAEFSTGAVADTLPIGRILLLLKRGDAQEAALKLLVEAQQDKSSPSYQTWLTPEQFGQLFGPSDADLQAVTDWLSAQGFRNVRVAAGKTVVEFSGTAGQVRDAFATQIQNYEVDGSTYSANASDPQIPAELAPVIAGIVSLHNFPRKIHSKFRGDAQRSASGGALQPQFTFPNPFGGSGNFYGVGPGDFATIYNSTPLIAAGTNGSGVTIGIVGETQINAKDVSDFRSIFGLSNNFSAASIILNGEDPGITSLNEESESDLDVQWSGAVAPGATVKLVVSASTPASAGVDLSALYLVEHNLADVISESYGECESNLGTAGNAFYNSLWEQAAAQGITVMVSSGDSGSAGCDVPNAAATHGLAVSGLSGTPFNISVGGTDFNQFNTQSTYWNTTNDSSTGTSAKGYIPEFPWNENCSQIGFTGCGSSAPNGSVNAVAGGGGASKVYGKPTWQMGVTGVPNDNHRDQPDISLFASPGFERSGYLFCQADLNGVPSCDLSNATVTFHIIGGTSASAPAFAGMMALVNQYSAAHGGSKRQGNANVTLYALARKVGASCTSSATEAAGCVFNDVVAPNIHFPNGAASNGVACKGGTPNCSAAVATTNGVLVDPAHTTAEAWTAGTGYDLATGLGSLNANNLVTLWGSVSTIGTTTTLTLTPTTGITHGNSENVSVTVSVKPNTGTGVAAGDVALIATLADGSTLGVDQFTLSNGAISSAKTQSLPGGTYKVHAHYTGDGTNAPSDSAPVQLTVGKESSQTFIVVPTFDSNTGKIINGNASSITYGSPYIIRMYVADSSAVASTTGPPAPTCFSVNEITCPTGSVTLTANGAAVDSGTFTLNNQGYTRDIAPTLTGGTYSLVAKYSGDNSYSASTAATDTLTIAPAQTSMSVPYIPFVPNYVGAPTPISAFLLTNFDIGVAPTGTITFFDNGVPITGTVTYTSRPGQPGALFPSISGAISATFSSSGTHAITATYSGDASYRGSTSTEWNASVLWPTNMIESASSTNINFGQSVTITAKVTTAGKNPPMTGSFQFYGSATSIPGPVSPTLSTDGSGNQILTASITTTPTNGEVIQVTYSGDSNFAPVSQSLFVNVNIPDFSLPQNTAITVTAGQTQTAMINVTPLSNTASTVTMVLPNAYGLPPGMTLSFAPATVSLNGSAVPVTATLVTTAPSGGPVPQSIRVAKGAIVLPSQGTWPTWPQSLLAGLVLFLVAVLLPRRRFAVRSVSLAASVLILSIQLGCGGGGSGGGGGGIVPTVTTIALTTSTAKVGVGGSFVLTATVSSSRPITGTVNIFSGPLGIGSGVAPPVALVNGKASVTVPGTFSPGIYPFWANYSGDANNLASQTTNVVQEAVTGSTSATYYAQTGGLSHQGTISINLQ